MEVFGYEFKKLMFHQKGWLVILVSVTSALLYWILADSPAVPDMELYRPAYDAELSEVEGPLTSEKKVWIDQAFSDVFAARQQLPELYREYYSGSLSESEFKKQEKSLRQSADRYQGLNVLYDQYLYVREAETDRWFLYTNGWDALLADNGPNLFLIAALVLLLVPFLCREYSCQMDLIILTTSRGSQALGIQKSILSLLIAGILSLLLDGLHVLFCMFKYGLPCPDAPIQSLQAFSGCIHEISLGMALGIIVCVRMVGAIFLAAFILAMAALTRKYAPSCFIVFSVLFLPWIALNDTVQYRLPIPLGWLRASGIFRGDETAASITGEEIMVFSHLTVREMIFLTVVALFLIVFCLIIVSRRGRNMLLRFQPSYRIVPILSALLTVLLTGCSDTAGPPPDVTFNSSQASVWYGDGFTVNASSVNMDSGTEIVVRLPDGSEENLVRTPFCEMQSISTAIFGTKESIAYLTSYTPAEDLVRLSERENQTIYRILCVDLTTFHEKVLFEAEAANDNKWAFLNQVQAFFLDEENLYFVLPEEIRQVNRFTHTVTVLDIPVGANIAFDGSRIYYLDETCCLASYDPALGSTEVLKNIAADQFVLGPSGVYYTDLRQGGQLCFYSFTKATTQILYEGPVETLYIEGDTLFFTTSGQEQSINLCSLQFLGSIT